MTKVEKSAVKLAEMYLKDHAELRKFLAGFRKPITCECDGCSIARYIIIKLGDKGGK